MCMNSSPTLAEFSKAMAVAQGQIGHASKDSRNPHFNSSYADLASIVDAIREPFAANGLWFVQALGRDESGFVVDTRIYHISGEWIGNIWPIVGDMRNPQTIGSATTYAKRQALSALSGVAPAEDDDGNAAAEAARSAPAPSRNGSSYQNGQGQRPGNGHSNGPAPNQNPRPSRAGDAAPSQNRATPPPAPPASTDGPKTIDDWYKGFCEELQLRWQETKRKIDGLADDADHPGYPFPPGWIVSYVAETAKKEGWSSYDPGDQATLKEILAKLADVYVKGPERFNTVAWEETTRRVRSIARPSPAATH